MTSRFFKLSRHFGCWAALALAIAQVPASAAGIPNGTAFVTLVDQAEAKSAARDWQAAAELWEKVVAANPVEGRFWSRLGNARLAGKDYRGAIPALEKAVELGSGFPENNAYNIACAYALLGDKDQAFDWLNRSLAARYLDLQSLAADPDLASLRGDPRFAKLVPVRLDTQNLSREAGWRSDLGFLLWQIDRLGKAPYRLRPRDWFVERFDALAASTGERTDLQMGLELARILRWLGDAHSGLMGGTTEDWALTLPVQFQPFEEGVFVTAAEPAHRDLVGARVIEFGGRPVEALMAAVAETVGRDNDGPWVPLQSAYRLRHVALLNAMGLVPDRTQVSLKVGGLDGRERTVRLEANTELPDIWKMKPHPAGWVGLGDVLPGPPPLYLRAPEKNYWFELLPAKRTLYVALNTVRDMKEEPLAAFAGRLARFVADQPVERVVIDLRWNNGGNTALLTPLIGALIASEKINRRGRLVALIGPRTLSAGQNAASLLERFTNVTFVGEPTGSSPNFIGEDDPFTLPYSKLNVNVSHLAWQSSLPQDRRTWIAPFLYVPSTFADYRAGRDAALEAVLDLPIPD
ncbi:MAG: TPR end-of-group domain-containing protein [Allosphingosinicella sp.]